MQKDTGLGNLYRFLEKMPMPNKQKSENKKENTFFLENNYFLLFFSCKNVLYRLLAKDILSEYKIEILMFVVLSTNPQQLQL